MSAPAIRDGEALALYRHLPGGRDAYSLFAALERWAAGAGTWC